MAACVIRSVDTAVQAVNCPTRFGRNQHRNWVQVHWQGVDVANALMQPGETSPPPSVKVAFPSVIVWTRSGQHELVRPTIYQCTAAFLTDVTPLHAAFCRLFCYFLSLVVGNATPGSHWFMLFVFALGLVFLVAVSLFLSFSQRWVLFCLFSGKHSMRRRVEKALAKMTPTPVAID